MQVLVCSIIILAILADTSHYCIILSSDIERSNNNQRKFIFVRPKENMFDNSIFLALSESGPNRGLTFLLSKVTWQTVVSPFLCKPNIIISTSGLCKGCLRQYLFRRVETAEVRFIERSKDWLIQRVKNSPFFRSAMAVLEEWIY